MKKGLLILALGSVLLSCGEEGTLSWMGMTLKEGNTPIGLFEVPEVSGISHREAIEKLDGSTYKLTCTFEALEDKDDVRLEARFVHGSKADFWMIPSVSYNGNAWGKGGEPKGAKEDGEWRTVSYRRTPIPGAMYSEGTQYAVATWSDVPASAREDFSISLPPE